MGRTPGFLLAAACLALLWGSTAGNATCENHKTCSECVNSTISNTTCMWFECKDSNDTCVNATEWKDCTSVPHCSSSSSNATTTVPAPTPTTHSTAATPANVSKATSTSATSVASSTMVLTTSSTPGTTDATKSPPKPVPHKSTFDAASFIGGIVLVLGVQAVFFFLYKFCKSKDRNYHTL